MKLWLNYTAAIFHPRRGEAVREPSEKEAEVLSCATDAVLCRYNFFRLPCHGIYSV